MFYTEKTPILKIEELPATENNVYDIGIDEQTPYFFANDILVHNSIYFSVDTAARNNEELKKKLADLEINKDNIIDLYDEITKKVNESFRDFLVSNFNANEDFLVIKAGRELVAYKGLFVTKKRYAVLIYDKEGLRLDKDGEVGVIKAMGLDLKRSDTPIIVQKFLENILKSLLSGSNKEEIFQKIKEFKNNFKKLKPWEKGIPKRVNGLTEYYEKYKRSILLSNSEEFFKYKKKEFIAIPGHVMASINYNKLKNFFKDNISMDIQDGMKIIVCYLLDNEFNIDSIAYPIDLVNLPEWFKKLPFDEMKMEKTVVDKKIENLLEVLEWNLNNTNVDTYFDDFFDFG